MQNEVIIVMADQFTLNRSQKKGYASMICTFSELVQRLVDLTRGGSGFDPMVRIYSQHNRNFQEIFRKDLPYPQIDRKSVPELNTTPGDMIFVVTSNGTIQSMRVESKS